MGFQPGSRRGSASLALAAALCLAAAGGACSRGRNIVLLVDTSGSMRRPGLMDDVRRSARRILLQAEPGDRVQLVTFDGAPALKLDIPVRAASDLSPLFDELERAEPRGAYTDLSAALEQGLRSAVAFKRERPRSPTKIILFTDGRHDPPPGRPAVADFRALFRSYFGGDAGRADDWFVYYVELDQPEESLERALAETGAGAVVSAARARLGEDFTRAPPDWKKRIAVASGALAALLALIQLLHPWFRSVGLVPAATAPARMGAPRAGSGSNIIDLGSYRKRLLRFRLRIATRKPELPLPASGPGQAELGVDLLGRYYVRARGGFPVLVNGQPVRGRRIIKPGQALIQLGATKYDFRKIA